MNKYKQLTIPEPSIQEPYKDDCLDRTQFGSNLKIIVDYFAESGAVVAIDGRWGTGKTTFIKMWQAQMMKDGYSTVYFNAWESDNLDDPLIAMIGELDILHPVCDKFKSLVSAGSQIAISAGIALLKRLIREYSGLNSSDIRDIGYVIDDAKQVFQSQIVEYTEQKKAFKAFKEALQKYVSSNVGQKPLVFIVDELDRCNPHYAVKVLERIKHLFDIPNIVFVLTINKIELEKSIKGFYGSDEIDASNYLHRFFNIELTLPTPKPDLIVRLLNGHYSLSKTLDSISDERGFFSSTKVLIDCFDIDIRTLERVFLLTQLVGTSLSPNEWNSHYSSVLLLCLIKVTYPEHFRNFEDAKMTHKEAICELDTIFAKRKKTDEYELCHILARFLELLGNDEGLKQFSDFLNNSENEFNSSFDRKRLGETFQHSNSGGHLLLQDVIDKVELNSFVLGQ